MQHFREINFRGVLPSRPVALCIDLNSQLLAGPGI